MGFREAWPLAFWLAASASAWAETAPPAASAIDLIDANGAAQLNVTLSRAVEATARSVVDPNRIVIDLPEVDFQLDPMQARPGSAPADALVRVYRYGLIEHGKSRIVIELNHPACIRALQSESGGGAARLSLTIESCPAQKFAELAKGAPTASFAPAAMIAPPPLAGLPVIVLDPGHGGADGGAHGAHGELEKNIVYDFAQDAKQQIEATHKFKVLLTRTGDAYVSLEDRVRFARDANAALMISIHADSLPGDSGADVSGTTVYTCSERASDAEAARIAEHENAADRGEGAKKPEEAGVADILFDLKRRETRAYAHLFSHGLIGQLRGFGRLNHNPERSAGFMVLKAPDFPSVLVELGYLSNSQDVANMTALPWRQRAAASLTTAVERFFAPNSGGVDGKGKTPEAVAGDAAIP